MFWHRIGKYKKVSNKNCATENYNDQNELNRWLNIILYAPEERISKQEDSVEENIYTEAWETNGWKTQSLT